MNKWITKLSRVNMCFGKKGSYHWIENLAYELHSILTRYLKNLKSFDIYVKCVFSFIK